MAIALVASSVRVYPLEVEESMRRTGLHVLEAAFTGLATDVSYDLAAIAAADTTNGPAITSLLNKADKILSYQFLQSARSPARGIKVLAGTVAGGAASTAMVVTGLLTTDTIIGIQQKAKNANSLPLLGYSTVIADGLTALYSADPGANGTYDVTVLRTDALQGDDHSFNDSATAPVWTFLSGSAPTALKLYMLVRIKDQMDYVYSIPSAAQ